MTHSARHSASKERRLATGGVASTARRERLRSMVQSAHCRREQASLESTCIQVYPRVLRGSARVAYRGGRTAREEVDVDRRAFVKWTSTVALAGAIGVPSLLSACAAPAPAAPTAAPSGGGGAA